jgi:SM-20-related protein
LRIAGSFFAVGWRLDPTARQGEMRVNLAASSLLEQCIVEQLFLLTRTETAPLPAPKFVILEEFLVAAEIRALEHYVLANRSSFAPSRVIGSNGTGAVRLQSRRSLVFMEIAKHRQVFEPRLRHFLPFVFQRLSRPSFTPTQVEMQLTVSRNGDFFRPHNDQSKSHPRIKTREITFIYYFHREPRSFTGGDLVLYGGRHAGRDCGWAWEKILRVPLVRNSLVFFPSDVLHEVSLVSCEEEAFESGRFTLNGWVHR